MASMGASTAESVGGWPAARSVRTRVRAPRMCRGVFMGADYSAWSRFADETYDLGPLGVVAGDHVAVVDAGGYGLLASRVVKGSDHSVFEADEGGGDLGGVRGVANDGARIIHEDGLGHDSDEARSEGGDAVRDDAGKVKGFEDAIA